jgi:hypothetical protein
MALPNVFSPGQIFTAANANLLRSNQYNQTVTTKTASYTPTTTTDIGTRVIMNSATATTITINTSIYTAGDTFFIGNIGVGVCTLTAGTCTISSAGPLAIPQNGGGTLYFTSASAAIFYPSAGATASSGLTFIAGSALTGSSVTFSNCFSATYNTYFITILGALSDSSTPYINFRFGSSTTQTYNTTYQTPGSGQTNHTSGTNVSQVTLCGLNTTEHVNSIITTAGPFLTQNTLLNAESTQATQFFGCQCNDQSTSSFTSFTLSTSSNNFSAGSVKIYGYANS